MYLGGDLSYVNEVEDHGGVFYQQGHAADPFKIIKEAGANIVRVRLWHTPTWTRYSTLEDVMRTIQRAKALDMAVLLDFHYSDTWADPAKQLIPAAWAQIDDLALLEKALYQYTVDVLQTLHQRDLLPEFVQVGNEINTEILMPEPHNGEAIRWARNVRLLNAGINAVRDFGQQTAQPPRVMLHIAQPENLIPWFDAAFAAGISANFDMIGLSYYPKWSVCSLAQMGQTLRDVRERYQKAVMLVETAYPWTLNLHRAESHLLSDDALLAEYPPTPQGQRDFLIALTQTVYNQGGSGVIYWEPAWISTPQMPSIWENATFFDQQGEVHEGIQFLSHSYQRAAQK